MKEDCALSQIHRAPHREIVPYIARSSPHRALCPCTARHPHSAVRIPSLAHHAPRLRRQAARRQGVRGGGSNIHRSGDFDASSIGARASPGGNVSRNRPSPFRTIFIPVMWTCMWW